MADPLDRQDEGARYLGSGLIRSGDQGMLVRESARPIGWLVIALVRAARYVYDAVGYLSRRR